MAFAPCNRYGVAGIIDDEGRHIVGSRRAPRRAAGAGVPVAHRFTAVAPTAAVDILLDPSANDAGDRGPARPGDRHRRRLLRRESTKCRPSSRPARKLIAYNLNRNGGPVDEQCARPVYHDAGGLGALARSQPGSPTLTAPAAPGRHASTRRRDGRRRSRDAAHGQLREIYLDRTKKYLG